MLKGGIIKRFWFFVEYLKTHVRNQHFLWARHCVKNVDTVVSISTWSHTTDNWYPFPLILFTLTDPVVMNLTHNFETKISSGLGHFILKLDPSIHSNPSSSRWWWVKFPSTPLPSLVSVIYSCMKECLFFETTPRCTYLRLTPISLVVYCKSKGLWFIFRKRV